MIQRHFGSHGGDRRRERNVPGSASIHRSVFARRVEGNDFRDGYTFFGVDLTPDACDGSCFHLVQKGNLRNEIHLGMSFAQTTNARDARTWSIIRDVMPEDGLSTTIDAYPIGFGCNTHERRSAWSTLDCAGDNRRGAYFYSYGLPPQHASFRTFMNEYCSEWTYNAKRLQSPLSNCN